MRYAFYADVFWFANFYLDFLALYSTAEILQQKKQIKRYVTGAAAGSLCACIFFLLVHNYQWYLCILHGPINVLLLVFCFFPASIKVYLKAYGLMYLFVFLEGGFMQWLYITQLQGNGYELCVVLTAIPIGIFLYLLRKKRKSVQIFYDVEIREGQKRWKVRALYDTGNRLWDPYTNCPVQVISAEIFKKLSKEKAYKMRLIPFATVAKEEGCLQAFTVEEIRFCMEQKEISIAPAVLAVAEQTILGQAQYQMILHTSACEK